MILTVLNGNEVYREIFSKHTNSWKKLAFQFSFRSAFPLLPFIIIFNILLSSLSDQMFTNSFIKIFGKGFPIKRKNVKLFPKILKRVFILFFKIKDNERGQKGCNCTEFLTKEQIYRWSKRHACKVASSFCKPGF